MKEKGLRRQMYFLLMHTPYFGSKLRELENCGYRPGHFYSPIPDVAAVEKEHRQIFGHKGFEIPGIDMNHAGQKQLLDKFTAFYSDFPYHFELDMQPGFRYRTGGAQYRHSDVVMLYSMIRHFNPSRIIEVGSGYSSAVMLDTNETFMSANINMTFIDPDDSRLQMLLTADDKRKHRILKQQVQHTDLSEFGLLGESDILFIDSSHVAKTGSDLNHILFNILPVLKPGVLVHFHDIHFPFEYPKHWVTDRKWFWNENYFLRSFLMYNNRFSIINFNSYLHQKEKEWLTIHMPACLTDTENTGSIWLRKN